MDGEAEEVAPLGVGVEALEEAARPVYVVAVGAHGDEAQRRAAVVRRPRGKAAEHCRVLLGDEVAAASPTLVAHAPQVHVEGVYISIRRALCGEGIRRGGRGGVRGHQPGGRVAVLDLLVEVARRQRAQVGGQIRLASDGAAGVHELVQAVAVGVLLAPEAGAGGAIGG